jgi:hypothetical protein
MNRVSTLVAIKLLHTIIWAFFVTCILAVPVAALERRFDWVAALTVLVLMECLILALNRRRCPLTDLAAKYTDDRADNFDIYLPRTLARHNQAIFGTLFVCGELVALWCWLSRAR